MNSQSTSPAAEPDALGELVRQHRMRWRASREEAVIGGEIRAIGLKLELSAIHAHLLHAPMPGCSECRPVIAALERVIDAVLPKEHRRSHYEVVIPVAKLEYPSTGQPEITATVTVLHNENVNDPIDECENRCLVEVIAKLRALGASEGRP